ncbi:hypothetical protein PTSG_06363 [Salpingoeca rosetta]|uniref:Large ribosomal subunit protein mL44 n=1 Tax=Salpingoeca rosetta (strain ATCC 50818 / BSB-021) TaxID=946362 RepID=F2UCP7_SALR5|nr:uncharacterized protein PTSG_06363 [Salpingoeca rosetta]EGD74354.1 hypothetical protein PTSG_06363 [Salpingoeca rosetta]|eukprot:XP_004993254.1 hypothetical protein PTSG_06363 [Salpingoeca rosetta]
MMATMMMLQRRAMMAFVRPSRAMAIVASHPGPSNNLQASSVTSEVSHSQVAEIRALAARTGEKFKDEKLLLQALTHRTYDGYAHNGRLSLLGETVLSQSVVEHLYFNFPNLYSTAIKSVRDRFLSADVLGPIGRKLGFQDALLYKHAEEGEAVKAAKPFEHNKRAKYHVDPVPPQKIPASAVAAAFKAFVGALYVDQGALQAKRYVKDFVVHTLENSDLSEFIKLEHPRRVLQRLHAASGREPLAYRVIEESGRATHMPTFLVGVFAGNQKLATGAGYSLQLAKAEAARAALRAHYLEEMAAAPLSFDSDDYMPEDEVSEVNNSSLPEPNTTA